MQPSKTKPNRIPFVPGDIESMIAVDGAEVAYEKQCVTIQGIVSLRGQGGWPRDDRDYEVHCFSFAAWRRLGETIKKRELTILRPVPRGVKYFGDFPEYTVHRMSVLLSNDETRAVLDKLLPPGELDAELLAFGEELRKPVIIPTKTFGDLVLNREIDWFEGEADWCGNRIEVHFYPDEKAEADDTWSIRNALETALVIWSNQREWDRKVTDRAVEVLLPIKNGNWLGDDETPLATNGFVRRMTLESISFYNDGNFGYWYDDGDLFLGHNIEVGGNLIEGARYANLQG